MAIAPHHIAFIMDGNGRWAKKRMLPRLAGHKKGAQTLQTIVEHCQKLAVKHVTFYAFSSENWERPADEVTGLMHLLRSYLTSELQTLVKSNVKLTICGDRSALADDICVLITNAESNTSHCDGITLNICLSYGARQELLHVFKQLNHELNEKNQRPDQLTIDDINKHLYTSHLPDPDLIIRTGGEQRLSNFLLWQSAYSELYFTDILWPDFDAAQLEKACTDFKHRERRYGR